MGTDRYLKNKATARPRKRGADRKRRETVHRRRLIALGVPEEKVRLMTGKQMRELLKQPAKLAAKT